CRAWPAWRLWSGARVAIPGPGPGRDHRRGPGRPPVGCRGATIRPGINAGAGDPGAVTAGPFPCCGAPFGRVVRRRRRGWWPGHDRVLVLLLCGAVARLGGRAGLAVYLGLGGT